VGAENDDEGFDMDDERELEGEEGQEEEQEEITAEMTGKYAPNMNDESDNVLMNMTKIVKIASMEDVFILEKFPRSEI
jgi:hypothetical protein